MPSYRPVTDRPKFGLHTIDREVHEGPDAGREVAAAGVGGGMG